MPTLGESERVSIIDVQAKFVTVRLVEAGHSQGAGKPFRQVFRQYVDASLRDALSVGLEALLVYDKIPHGVGYWLRPLPEGTSKKSAPIKAITAADVARRARKRELVSIESDDADRVIALLARFGFKAFKPDTQEN